MFPKIERSDSGNRGAARRPRARVGQLAAALIVLIAVAGCSSSSSPSAAPSTASSSPPASLPSTAAPVPPSTPQSPAVTGPLACATSSLNVTLGPSSGYAGGVYQTIVFTNTSGTTCTLFGYPGVSLVSAPPYKQIGLAAQRASTVPVKLITLATGASRQRRPADRGRAELRDCDLQPDPGGLPADLPAEPDRPGVPGRHVGDMRSAGPDPVYQRRPGRRGRLRVTPCFPARLQALLIRHLAGLAACGGGPSSLRSSIQAVASLLAREPRRPGCYVTIQAAVRTFLREL